MEEGPRINRMVENLRIRYDAYKNNQNKCFGANPREELEKSLKANEEFLRNCGQIHLKKDDERVKQCGRMIVALKIVLNKIKSEEEDSER